MKPARESASSRPKPCAYLKNSRILPVRRSLLALVGRKQTMARDQLFPQKPPGSRLVFRSRDVSSAVPPRVVPHIFCSRSESVVYSRAPRLPPAFRGGIVLYASFGRHHHIRPEFKNEPDDAGRDGRTCPAGANGDREIFTFPV